MTKTNAGNDFQYGVMAATASNGTGTYAPANYIALSATGGATGGTETTLAGEINAASGGLNRAQATSITHTAGTNTYALSKTFTTNANDSLPVTIATIGVFNAASTGTLVFRTVLGTTATLSAVGDQLTITDTVTM